MAEPGTEQAERKEKAAEGAPKAREQKSETPVDLSGKRGAIAGALEARQEGEVLEGAEVKEVVAEAGERAGETKPVVKKKKKDEGKAATAVVTTDELVFEREKLPEVPEMIAKIEDKLRAEIKKLQKEAKYHRGNIFRKPNLSKLSETMGQLRKKYVMLKRLATMAAESIKKIFMQMFGAKKA